MSSDDDLPVILVSAVDTAAALAIIKELISDDTEPPQSNGVGSHAGDGEAETADAGSGGGAGVVWRLENKYYTARVRLLPAPDRARRATAPGDVEAHLIYLTEDECSEPSALSWRVAAAAGRLARGGVRLAGARCGAGEAGALRAAAAAARYELVPLADAAAPEPGEPFPELRGAARLREALHAHPWPGLQRRGAPGAPLHFAEEDSSAESSGDESWGSWRRAGSGGGGEEGEDEAGAVARAEQFAAALALLPAAGEAAAAGEADAARRLRAEQLVAAFCRALGHDLGADGGGGGEGGAH